MGFKDFIISNLRVITKRLALTVNDKPVDKIG